MTTIPQDSPRSNLVIKTRHIRLKSPGNGVLPIKNVSPNLIRHMQKLIKNDSSNIAKHATRQTKKHFDRGIRKTIRGIKRLAVKNPGYIMQLTKSNEKSIKKLLENSVVVHILLGDMALVLKSST